MKTMYLVSCESGPLYERTSNWSVYLFEDKQYAENYRDRCNLIIKELQEKVQKEDTDWFVWVFKHPLDPRCEIVSIFNTEYYVEEVEVLK